MASLTIRQLDETTKARLRARAARHRCSMEEEARRILRSALADDKVPSPADLAEAIHRRFERFGGVELQLPARQPMREPRETDE